MTDLTPTAIVQFVLAGPAPGAASTPTWQILIVVLPIVVNSLLAFGFALWTTHQKGKTDVAIEELKAQLANLGSEQHLKFQTVYGKQCNAAEVLTAKHYEIFMALLHLTTTRDVPLYAPYTLVDMLAFLKHTTFEALQVGHTYTIESFMNQRLWLEEESELACRQVVNRFGVLQTKLSGMDGTTTWEDAHSLALAADPEITEVHDAITQADRALRAMVSPTDQTIIA